MTSRRFLTAWYLADPLQPGVAVKRCGVVTFKVYVVEQEQKVLHGAPHGLVGGGGVYTHTNIGYSDKINKVLKCSCLA